MDGVKRSLDLVLCIFQGLFVALLVFLLQRRVNQVFGVRDDTLVTSAVGLDDARNVRVPGVDPLDVAGHHDR
jgi:hypothetical protein